MKKAQLQIAENIGILVVFFILLVFGLVFYVSVKETTYESTIQEFSELSTVSTSQKALNMPELLCTKGFNVFENYCFDTYKLKLLTKYLKKNPLIRDTIYFDKFKNSVISVEEVYPKYKKWVLYNRTLEKVDSSKTQLPISLFNASSDEYYFAVLTVEVFG
tara:strand:+ start:304 stop:786 length:483 start_codon:yes stop_codon:yes gene_type:complete